MVTVIDYIYTLPLNQTKLYSALEPMLLFFVHITIQIWKDYLLPQHRTYIFSRTNKF